MMTNIEKNSSICHVLYVYTCGMCIRRTVYEENIRCIFFDKYTRPFIL